MESSNYKYTARFESVAKIINPSEEERSVALASLAPLKSLIPSDVDPTNDPDLLYIAANGALAGMMNKNFDAISCETALKINSTAKNKYINNEHKREDIFGVVLYTGFTKFGSNEILTPEEASKLQEPFNMAVAGVLWKVANPALTKYINNTTDADLDEQLSLSWEIGFDSWDIGYGSKNLFEATIIKPGEPSFDMYNKFLRANGGEGKDASGKEVFRIITGDPVILGYGIVVKPAAEVKGILPIVKEPAQAEAPVAPASIDLSEIPEAQRAALEVEFGSDSDFHLCDVTLNNGVIRPNIPILNRRYLPKSIDVKTIAFIKKCEKNEEKIITPINERVTINIAKTMKIDSIDQLVSQWGELRKMESAAAVADFVKAIQDGSEQFVADLKAKEDLVKNAEAAKKESEARASKLEAKLDEATKILGELRAKAESAEAMQVFNDRMATLDTEFDLDDEDRQVLASDVKALADDSAFAAYMAKCKVLMKGKAKKVKKADDSDSDDDNDDDDETQGKKKHTNPSDTAGSAAAEAIASVKEDPKDTTIKSTVTVEETMADKVALAFGSSLKIDGKSVTTAKK